MSSSDVQQPPAAMQVDHTNSSSNNSSGGGNGSSLVQQQIQSIETTLPKLSESILRHLSKTLTSVRKAPTLLANRKWRCDNIAVKKFISDVPGALEIVKFIGYTQQELTDKKVPYLILEETIAALPETTTRIQIALDAINTKLAEYDAKAAAAAAPPAAASSAAGASAASATGGGAAKPAEPRQLCLGGCGFFGSAETENYCSVCFKKKFLAGGSVASSSSAATAATSSPAKPSSVPSNPYVTPPKPGNAAALTIVTPLSSFGLQSASSLPVASQQQKCLKYCGRFAAEAKYNGFCAECYQKITAQGSKPPPPRWKVRAVVRFNRGKKPVQENKSRCWTCQKKIGITGFECRCRYVFCSEHRYMDKHSCTYDVKGLHRRKLQKENAEIRAAKIERL